MPMKLEKLLIWIGVFFTIFGIGGGVFLQTEKLTLIAGTGPAIIILVILLKMKKKI